jgi:ketosteroid isomerase-like protein
VASNQLDQAAANKALVERRFEAAMSGDRETVAALQAEGYTVEFSYGHPAEGTFQGKEQIAVARGTMLLLLGITGFRVDEVITEGPHRVIALAGAEGADVAGEPWSMELFEVLTVVDGLVAEERLLFKDTARLREIARAREEAA